MLVTNEAFSFCKGHQRSCTELIVYSREAKQIVQIAYPTDFGRRVIPSGVHAFLRRRGTFWECFCGLESDEPIPARFVNIVCGATVRGTEVRCHHYNDRCGFRLNLNETRHTARYVSDYAEFLPTGHGNLPDVAKLTTDFRRAVAQAPNGLAQLVRFFPGYLGSPSVFYPGFSLPILDVSFQPVIAPGTRSHSRRHSATFPRAKTILLGTSHARRTSAHLAPSTSTNSAPDIIASESSSDEDSPRERELLLALANGFGISNFDAAGLLEECTSCGNKFMASRLRRHIRCEECGKGMGATVPSL